MSDDKLGRYGQVISLALDGVSYSEIAKKIGVARQTLYNWREDKLYKALEVELRTQAHDTAISELHGKVTKAVKVLDDILEGKFLDPRAAQARFAVAKFVLEHAGIGAKLAAAPLDDASDEELDELAERVGFVRASRAQEDAH